MKSFTATAAAAILSFTSSTTASPVSARETSNLPFALESTVGLASIPINAADSTLWVYKDTATYCPGAQVPSCGSYSNRTSFTTNPSNGAVSLNAAVPGGQQLYIAPNGLVTYTEPHSAAMPAHSTVEGVYDAIVGDSQRAWFCGNESTSMAQMYVSEGAEEQPSIGLQEGVVCTKADTVYYSQSNSDVAAWEYA